MNVVVVMHNQAISMHNSRLIVVKSLLLLGKDIRTLHFYLTEPSPNAVVPLDRFDHPW